MGSFDFKTESFPLVIYASYTIHCGALEDAVLPSSLATLLLRGKDYIDLIVRQPLNNVTT